MGRMIAAVIVAYIVMVAVVFAGLTVAYVVMGAEGAFTPGSYEVSTAWVTAMLAVGLVAAFVGGMVASVIGRGMKGAYALAVVVIILGALSAIPAFTAGPAAERAGDVAMFDAMGNAVQPVWYALINPIIGVIGVLIGGAMVKPHRPDAP